jgi:hypothetical protein
MRKNTKKNLCSRDKGHVPLKQHIEKDEKIDDVAYSNNTRKASPPPTKRPMRPKLHGSASKA